MLTSKDKEFAEYLNDQFLQEGPVQLICDIVANSNNSKEISEGIWVICNFIYNANQKQMKELIDLTYIDIENCDDDYEFKGYK